MKYIVVFFISIFLVNCKTAESSKTSNQAPSSVSWIAAPSFTIDCTVAYPLVTNELAQINNLGLRGAGDTANRINLMGRGDFLKIANETVTANMSFYGEQRGGNFLQGRTGIIMDGPLENYTTSVNERKKYTRISFSTRYLQEAYDVIITKYRSGNCTIDINSSVRTFMNYDGVMKEHTPE